MLRGIAIQGVKSFPKDAPVRITLDQNKPVSLFYGLNGLEIPVHEKPAFRGMRSHDSGACEASW
jgi:hypothetical protein